MGFFATFFRNSDGEIIWFQMFCPVVCIVVPFVITSLYANTMSIVTNYMCLVGITAFPAVNATLTIVFVSPYRKRTAELLRTIVNAKPKDVSVIATLELTEPSAQSLSSNYGQRIMQASTRRLQVTPVPVG